MSTKWEEDLSVNAICARFNSQAGGLAVDAQHSVAALGAGDGVPGLRAGSQDECGYHCPSVSYL